MSEAPSFERARLTAVLTAVGIAAGATVLLAGLGRLDWRVGLGLSLLANSLLLVYGLCWRDRVMAHLLVFGLVLGLVELAADAWLVDVTRTLEYATASGPLVWRSPVYMPLVWQFIAVQVGCLGASLMRRWRVLGVVAAGMLGVLVIPFYEEIALRIDFWKYSNCKLVLHTPQYIVLGDFAIAVCTAVLVSHVRPARLAKTLCAGATGGACILVCYAVAYWLVDRAF